MELALLLDIGSTYTKTTVIDLQELRLVASAKALTTIQEDVTIGIKNAFTELKGCGIDFQKTKYRLACSSAAGGLKMVAIGLVPELTAEAAKRAILGAGAKLVNVYAFELSNDEVKEIILSAPDIILLAGGTDGGNKDVILANAQLLSQSDLAVPIVVAGNKAVALEVKKILEEGSKEVYLTENVMPKLGVLNVDPARKIIRKIFLDKIIYAKGLDKARGLVQEVIMPTPSAVMAAAELLAKGTAEEEGFGELMIVDIGGATTDIHSVATGNPSVSGVNLRGLPEPYIKRTVEGDLGMRYNALSVVTAVGKNKFLKRLSDKVEHQEVEKYLARINELVDYVPQDECEKEIDRVLARIATKLAVQRHVGRLETVYTPFGDSYIQYGKDLTNLNLVIGTGGVLVHNEKPSEILNEVLFDYSEPTVLAPKSPEMMIDSKYLLAAIGLLMKISPTKALRVIKRYLRKDFR